MDTSGTWLDGYTLIFIILVVLSPFAFVTQRAQPTNHAHDIELGEFPSFVNPELVQERLSMPVQPDIDFPPAAHLRPSSDRHSARPDPMQELVNCDGRDPRVIPVALNNVSVLDL